MLRAREVALQTRTKIINSVRGITKAAGRRLPDSASLTFVRKAKELCSGAVKPALLPLLRIIEELTREIELYDRMVAKKAETEYPGTQAIQTIHGVGPLTALTFVLVLNNDRRRFRRSRDVGCYIGLRPKQRESGKGSPNWTLANLAIRCCRDWRPSCAQYILGPFGRDSALRRWGMSLACRGG